MWMPNIDTTIVRLRQSDAASRRYDVASMEDGERRRTVRDLELDFCRSRSSSDAVLEGTEL